MTLLVIVDFMESEPVQAKRDARRQSEERLRALVHGLAELMTAGGPLSRLRRAERTAAIDRTLTFPTTGLALGDL